MSALFLNDLAWQAMGLVPSLFNLCPSSDLGYTLLSEQAYELSLLKSRPMGLQFQSWRKTWTALAQLERGKMVWGFSFPVYRFSFAFQWRHWVWQCGFQARQKGELSPFAALPVHGQLETDPGNSESFEPAFEASQLFLYPQEEGETIQGSIHLSDGQSFGFEVMEGPLGYEGFIQPELKNKAELASQTLLSPALDAQAPRRSSKFKPVVNFRFGPPGKIYAHISRPIKKSGVVVGVKPLELTPSQLLAALKFSFESLMEIEKHLQAQLSKAQVYELPTFHLETLAKVCLKLPKCTYEGERFYAVPESKFLIHLRNAWGQVGFQRLAGGMVLELPNDGGFHRPVWCEVIEQLEEGNPLKCDRDEWGNRCLKTFNVLGSVALSLDIHPRGGVIALAGLELELSARYLEQTEWLTVPLEMPDYSEERYEKYYSRNKKSELAPTYQELIANIKPYEDLPKLESLLTPLQHKNQWGEICIASVVPNLSKALRCQHTHCERNRTKGWRKMVHSIISIASCNEGCEAEWELLKFSQVHPHTRRKIEVFYSCKSDQLGLGLQSLYDGYPTILGKDWEFKDWLFCYPALKAYPHVARAIVQADSKDSENFASEPKAITVDENEQGRARRNDPSYRVVYELKYHNGVIREYANKRWAQVEEALMRLEGLTYVQAYDNYLASQILSLEGGTKGSWVGRAIKNLQRSLGTAVEQFATNLPLSSSNERIASGQKQLSEGVVQPQRVRVERGSSPQTTGSSSLPLKSSGFFLNASFGRPFQLL